MRGDAFEGKPGETISYLVLTNTPDQYAVRLRNGIGTGKYFSRNCLPGIGSLQAIVVLEMPRPATTRNPPQCVYVLEIDFTRGLGGGDCTEESGGEKHCLCETHV